MSSHRATRRQRGLTSGRALLTRVLVLLLVPAVSLAATDAAHAASNLNQWQVTHVGKSDILVGIDGIDCAINSRYTGTGESVQWANSGCTGGPDTSTGFAQPGEPGSHITLDWKGTRAGEVALADTWRGGTCGGSTLSGDTESKCQTFNGFPALTIYSPSHDVSGSGNWMLCVHKAGDSGNYQAAYATVNGQYVAIFQSGTVAADWERVFYGSKSVGCAGASGAKIHVEARGYNWLLPDAGEPAGAGAGNACKATSGQLTLGASTQNNWSGIASTVPSGAADVPEAVGGVCTFTQLCATFHSDNGIMPDSQFTSCADIAWPAPAAVPATGDTSAEPTAGPAPGHENPAPPTTEPGFWEAILGALAAGFKMLWNALSGIFGVLAKMVGAILDGIKGLFIPSDGFFGAQVAGVKDAWDQTPPAVLIGEVTAIPDKLVVPSSSGCEGLAVPLRLPNYTGGEQQGSTTLHPFTTCDPSRQKVADLVRIALQLTVAAGAFLAGVRILGASIGMDTSLGRGADA